LWSKDKKLLFQSCHISSQSTSVSKARIGFFSIRTDLNPNIVPNDDIGIAERKGFKISNLDTRVFLEK
jgi:hypothetical protein